MSRGDRARQIADRMFDRDIAPNAWRAAEAGALKALAAPNMRQIIPSIMATHAAWIVARLIWG